MSTKTTKTTQKKAIRFNKKLAWRILCIILCVVMLASLVIPAFQTIF